MSSKKKRRYEEYLKRQEKREKKKVWYKRKAEVEKNGSMEDMAKFYGIPLK